MKNLSTAEIRKTFLTFFSRHGATVEKSSSLVPINDPTLLFTSAGMVQFKDVFTGLEKRPYTRATTAQKCLRAGGKHNDLENVGFTARHHTFFEMLGNFSFGDYFKREAIHWAWELVTKTYALPAEKLFVTVFREDDEAYDIWHKEIGVPKERIFRFDEKDNFWSAGDVGPCGPCTEIYFDRGPTFNTGDPELDRMGGDGGRFLEFYNLVFMQYNRDAQGNLSPLPRPSVDTGMGLERLASILQDVRSNYDIDLFQTIIGGITKITKAKYSSDLSDPTSSAIRVIADHLRAVSFLMADGVLPSNEGRGYVLRRILRRAVRYGKKLGQEKPFLHELVPVLVSAMGETYPELRQKEGFIVEAIKNEEEKFLLTLVRGLEHLASELKGISKGGKLPGTVAFLLYDSFGFPLDLTAVVCREHGISVDEESFHKSMEAQKARSRGSESLESHSSSSGLYNELSKRLSATDFSGYDSCEGKGKLLAILSEGKEVSEAKGPKSVELVFDRTPFYGESGGQVGDKGSLQFHQQKIAEVIDAKKPVPELIILKTELLPGATISVGQVYEHVVVESIRRAIRSNHTATHLLHWALREVLGDHVKQAGSLVSPDQLRFDFTHIKAMSEEEKNRVEHMVNEKIFTHSPLAVNWMEKDEAISRGAMALFGEKYDAKVRVVAVGDGFSTELCGGTHVNNTAEIGMFYLASEGGVAAGVRRIVAHTGAVAWKMVRENATVTQAAVAVLKVQKPEEVLLKLDRLVNKERELEKRLNQVEAQAASAKAGDLVKAARKIKDILFISHILERGGSDAMKALGEKIRDHMPRGIAVIGAKEEDKAHLLVLVCGDLTKTYNAGKIVQAVSPKIQGKGGGKPDQAQAGGTDPSGLAAACEAVAALL
jgi:alanyl-tRNA synthetase